jgi:hypothetical protein
MSIFDFPEKLLAKNKRFFDETIMKNYGLLVFYNLSICDDKNFYGKMRFI